MSNWRRLRWSPADGFLVGLYALLSQVIIPATLSGAKAGPHIGWPFWVWVIAANLASFALMVSVFAYLTSTTFPRLINRIWAIAFFLSFGYVSGKMVALVFPMAVPAARVGDIGRLEWCAAFADNLNTRDNTGETPLIAAINNHQTEAVKRLVELGAEVKPMDAASPRPLSVARQTQQPEIVAYLKEHGAE